MSEAKFLFLSSLQDCLAPGDRSDEHEMVIMCPRCAFDYGHIVDVFTREGSDPFEGRGAYTGTEVKGSVGSRRGCLVIVFEGECGHLYEWRIQQHKGNNFVSAAYVGDAPDRPSLFPSWMVRPSFWYRVPVLGWFLCVRNHGLYQQPTPAHSDGGYWCSWCRRNR